MKSKALFLGLLLSLLMNPEVRGANDYQIDKFNFDFHSKLIAGYLWRGEKVPDEEIERICNSVIKTTSNSDASIDSITGAAITISANDEVEMIIRDFLEVTEDVAEVRSKRKKQDSEPLKSSLQLFAEKIRKTQHDPHSLKVVLDAVAEEYC